MCSIDMFCWFFAFLTLVKCSFALKGKNLICRSTILALVDCWFLDQHNQSKAKHTLEMIVRSISEANQGASPQEGRNLEIFAMLLYNKTFRRRTTLYVTQGRHHWP